MSTKSNIKNQKLKLRNLKICNLQFAIFNSKAGLTLIEVLVAVTLLAVGLLGVALMQVASISGTTYSREMATATDLGQDMLEKLMASPYTAPGVAGSASPGTNHPNAADVANGLAVGIDVANIIDERGLTVGPPLYTRQWNVIDPGQVVNTKDITVTVSWTEKGSVATTRKIEIRGIKVSE